MKLRNAIMEYFHPSTLLKISSSLDEERVEISTNLATSNDVLSSEMNHETKIENVESQSVPPIKSRHNSQRSNIEISRQE